MTFEAFGGANVKIFYELKYWMNSDWRGDED